MRRIVKIRIVNIMFPDCWYAHLIGQVIDVIETKEDYVVIDEQITHNKSGEYNNTGLICKTDAIVI